MSLIKKVIKVDRMALVEGNIPELKNRLTIRGTGKEIKILHLYKEAGEGRLLIPRALVDGFIPSRPEWETSSSFMFKGTLRENQKPLVDSFMYKVVNTPGRSGGILKATTGSGKTVIGLYLAAALNLKTLIIVPTDRLMTQWKDRIKQFLGIPASRIGEIRQNIVKVKGCDIVVAMIHSLAQKEYPKYIYDYFGLTIYDECHVLGAETFSRTAALFNSKYRLGLSATPRRKDGCENVFTFHIGKVVGTYTTPVAIPKVILLPYKGSDTSHAGCIFGGDLSLGRYYNRLACSMPRTRSIASVTFQLYKKGKDILVLSDRITLLENLKQLLLKMSVPRKDIGMFTGSTKQLNRKILLGTYGSAGLGADIPRLNALIFATPRADIEQPLGRVTRNPSGSPVVIDFVDTQSSIMVKWMYSRLKFYRRTGCKVINKVTN